MPNTLARDFEEDDAVAYQDIYESWKSDPEAFWMDAAKGIDWVLVNGRIAVADGEVTGELAGKIIYGPGRTRTRRAAN